MLQRVLYGVRLDLNKYPRFAVEVDPTLAHYAQRLYDISYTIDPTNQAVRWGRGRIELIMGKSVSAAETLAINDVEPIDNPLRFLDTLASHVYAEDTASVIQLAHRAPNRISESKYRDDVIAILLSEYQATTELQQSVNAQSLLEDAYKIRAFDLYTNYQLWLMAKHNNNAASTSIYLKSLQYYPAEAIELKNERLISFTFSIVPDMVEEGIWDKDRTINTISFWIWRYSYSNALADLITELAKRSGKEAIWYSDLGELYYRRGDLNRASRYYQLALNIDPTFNDANVGLHKLTGGKTSAMSSDTEQRTYDRETVAQLFGLSVSEVELGPNLITPTLLTLPFNGNSEEWNYTVYEGNRSGWQFAAGHDSFTPFASLRIANLWWPNREDGVRLGPYAPYAEISSIGFNAPNWLVLSLEYRVQGNTSDNALVFVGSEGKPYWQPQFADTLLGSTTGWKHLVIAGHTPRNSAKLFLLLRNWGAAQVYFQEIEVRSITVSTPPNKCLDIPCVYIQ